MPLASRDEILHRCPCWHSLDRTRDEHPEGEEGWCAKLIKSMIPTTIHFFCTMETRHLGVSVNVMLR